MAYPVMKNREYNLDVSKFQADEKYRMNKMIQDNSGQIYSEINGYIPGVSNI